MVRAHNILPTRYKGCNSVLGRHSVVNLAPPIVRRGTMVPASLVLLCLSAMMVAGKGSECDVVFGDTLVPVICHPPFENVAIGMRPQATSTCGLVASERVCSLTASGRYCAMCDAAQPGLAHPETLMTDGRLDTHWRSQTHAAVSGGPVNVTLSFNRTFEVASVRVVFAGSPPESFAVLKSSDFGRKFTALHYFSASCSQTYNVSEGVQPVGDSGALCTSDGATSTPRRSGEAVVLPLEGRPSAGYVEHSIELREWLQLTDIRLQLDRLSTFGDEQSGDLEVSEQRYHSL